MAKKDVVVVEMDVSALPLYIEAADHLLACSSSGLKDLSC